MQNVLVAVFEVESEGFQALTEIKQNPSTEKSIISEAVLVSKKNGVYKVEDSFDTGFSTSDDTAIGGLVGMCVGIIGGSIGMLLGASYGMLAGMALDAVDSIDDASLIEQIAGKLEDGMTAIIALTEEEDETILDGKLSSFNVVIARFDAAVVAQEVEEAQKMEKELRRQAKAEMRKEKKEDFKEKVEAKRNEIKADFEGVKEKLKKES